MDKLNVSVGQTGLHPAIRDQLLAPLLTPAYFGGYRALQQYIEWLVAETLRTAVDSPESTLSGASQ